MSTTDQQAKQLFLEAVETISPDQRAAFLESRCGENAELRGMVEELLNAHAVSDSLLDQEDSELERQWRRPLFPPPETRIGAFKLREQIGEGGFGVVFVAEQEQPIRRKVALKIIKPGMDSQEIVARFEAERQALALMEHPNVARVLDAGTTETGRPYFVMELVRGVPITRFCESQRLTTNERLRLFADVCLAVQHAHQKGIIHRDLKPNNVLVTLNDGIPVPKVIDFGVAKALNQRLTENTIYTSLGQMVGTPLYMSPEQAELSGLDVDTRSDVYSLGVLLYELLTGTTPFDTETFKKAGLDEMRRIIRETDPPKPSVRVSTVRTELHSTICDKRRVDQRKMSQALKGELDWIVMKALEKDRNRRYESPLAFNEDIRAYLTGNTVRACPASIGYRFQKFAKKNKRKLVTFSSICIALCLGLFVAVFQRGVALDAKRLAEERLEKVEYQKLRIERLLYVADVRLAAQALRDGDPQQTKALLNRHRPLNSKALDLRGVEWHYLMQHACGDATSAVLSSSPLYAVCLSPDRQRLATAGTEGQIFLLNVNTLKTELSFDSGQIEVNGLCFSKNGERLLSAGDNGTICLWNAITGQKLKSFHFGEEKAYMALFTPDETHVIACGHATDVRIFSWESTELVASLNTHNRPVEAIALSPEGRLVACASSDSTLSIWDWQKRRHVTTIQPHHQRLTCTKFSPNGRFLVDGSTGALVRLFRTEDWALIRNFKISDDVQSVAFSPDSDSLAIGTRSGVIHHCPLTNLDQVKKDPTLVTLHPHEGRVYDLLYVDHQSLVSVGQDGCLRRFNASKGSRLQSEISDVRARHVAVSSGGKQVAWINGEQIGIHDLEKRGPITLAKFPRGVTWSAVQFSPNRQVLVATTTDGRLVTATGPGFQAIEIQTLSKHIDGAELSFSADGRRLAVTSRRDDWVLVLTFPELGQPQVFPASDVQKAVLSAEGKFLALNRGRDLLVYDVESGQSVAKSIQHHHESIRDLLFLKEHDEIVTFGNDKAVKIWDWRNNSSTPELLGIHGAGLPISVAATSDDLTLFTADRSGEVLVWNIPTRQKLFPITRSGSLGMSLSRDGSTLVTVEEVEDRINCNFFRRDLCE